MTRAEARMTANVILGVAGVAAAYVVMTTPSLRRLAVRGLRLWLGASVPLYLMNEARRAWMQSGQAA
jgi:hypothetical protein